MFVCGFFLDNLLIILKKKKQKLSECVNLYNEKPSQGQIQEHHTIRRKLNTVQLYYSLTVNKRETKNESEYVSRIVRKVLLLPFMKTYDT